MSIKHIVAVMVGTAALVSGTAAGQHRWKPPATSSGRTEPIRPITIAPRAAIGGGANGIYCLDMVDDAVGVHHLGWIPAGLSVAVTVESYSEGAFNPVAAVIVATLGQKAGDTVKATTFYDNDSGGDQDARVSFVTPQAGTYLLLVTDYSGAAPGCYRYQTDIR